jgi:voltage-gated potassium channel Kch
VRVRREARQSLRQLRLGFRALLAIVALLIGFIGNLRREVWRSLRQHRLGFLTLLAIVALLIGFIGYLRAHYSVVDAVYGTLSLLAFNYYGPTSHVPLTLELARFIVPAVAAFATFTALVAVMEGQWHLARARFKRGHVVVCGLGRRGTRLVRSLRASDPPTSVVAVEADRASPNVDIARRLGAIVVTGDPTEEAVLYAAGVQRAATLVSVLPEDAENAAVASVARELCRSRAGTLSAYCHLADMDLVKDLTSVAASHAKFDLDWFSVPELAARLLLNEHAHLVSRSKAGEAPHLVVVGTDDLSRAIVVNAARVWRAAAGSGANPIRLTVAWADAQDWCDRLAEHYPSVTLAAELNPYANDLRASARRAYAKKTLSDATAVFICAPSDTESLELGFAASRVVSKQTTVVVRLLLENAGFVELLESERGPGSIRLFSVVDRTCSIEMVEHGFTETLARVLHAVYRHQSTDSDGSVPWAKLPDRYKSSNRAQARHVRKKLESVNCEIQPRTEWDSPLMEFNVDEVERLAELEHERWEQERLAEGWRFGMPTDRKSNISEWLVPWKKLPDHIKEIDREFVRDLPKALAAAGYEIERTDT